MDFLKEGCANESRKLISFLRQQSLYRSKWFPEKKIWEKSSSNSLPPKVASSHIIGTSYKVGGDEMWQTASIF